MRGLPALLTAALIVAAPGAAPAGVAGSPPITVLQALPGRAPSPATGQQAVALARGGQDVPSALARPYKTELGWTAQWRGGSWWLVGVYESDWGTRFVVRALVRGSHVKFGAGPTRRWILDDARPRVTTLYTRFDPTSAVAQMQGQLMSMAPPQQPGEYPDFDPRNYTILAGAATLVRDEPEPEWWFVYYARDHRTGRNVVVPVTSAGDDPPVPESSIQTGMGRSSYGFWGIWPRNDVQPGNLELVGWVDHVIATRDWQPADWPSVGRDETFWSIPPVFHRAPSLVPRVPGKSRPSPSTAEAAVEVARGNLDIPTVLAAPFAGGGSWTAQWRGHDWWLVAVFRSNWGKRFVVRAEVSGRHVRFGTGAGRRWILEHAQPRLEGTLYTRLKPSSAVSLLKAEMLAAPVSRFDSAKYAILDGAAELVRDAQQADGSGPEWRAVYYATDRATGKNVVLPVVSVSHGPLVETTYSGSEPGSTAYGFQSFDVLPNVPASSSGWVRSVVAARGWHPTNFH